MKQHLEYKGYLGSVEADLDEAFLYGRLLFIRDVVSYRSDDIACLRTAFESAVDDYLATCAELGEVPELPCKGSFNVRIGPDLHQRVALEAARAGVSLNEWVREACAKALAHREEGADTVGRKAGSQRIEAQFDDDTYNIQPGGTGDWQQQSQPPKVH